LAELVCRSEVSWGTHERRMPKGSQMFDHGPRNMLVLPRRELELGQDRGFLLVISLGW